MTRISVLLMATLVCAGLASANTVIKQLNANTFYASQFCSTPGTLDQTCVLNILTTPLCQQSIGVPCHIILDPASLTNSTYHFASTVSFVIPSGGLNCPANIGCPVNVECLDKTVTIVANGNYDAFDIGSNSRIANCHLVGSGNSSNGGNKAINVSTQSNVWIEDNVIEQFGATQILCGGECTNIHIRDNIIKNGANEGILLSGTGGDSSDNEIIGNEVFGNGCNGIDIEGLRNVVANNNSRNNGGGTGCVNTGNANGIVFVTQTNANDNVFVGNTLTGNQDMGFDAVCTEGTMQDNVIENNVAANNAKDGFRLIYSSGNGSCRGNALKNNVANFNAGFGIVSQGGGTGSYSQNVLGPNSVAQNTSGPLSSDGIGIQDYGITMIATVGGCITSGGSSPFKNPCTNTVTWFNGWTNGIFPNTAYKASCTGSGISAGVPLLQAITSRSTVSVNVQTQQATGADAQFTNIECVGSE